MDYAKQWACPFGWKRTHTQTYSQLRYVANYSYFASGHKLFSDKHSHIYTDYVMNLSLHIRRSKPYAQCSKCQTIDCRMLVHCLVLVKAIFSLSPANSRLEVIYFWWRVVQDLFLTIMYIYADFCFVIWASGTLKYLNFCR